MLVDWILRPMNGVWAMYFAALEVLSWGTSKLPLCIVISEYQQPNNKPGDETCATLHEGVFRFLGFIWDHTTHKNIEAAAAVFIALFTLTLWRSTRALWKAGERHAERQLRAYVSIDGMQIMDMNKLFNKRDFEVHVVAKNYGQTPAYDVTSLAEVAISTSDAPVLPQPVGTRRKSTLGHGAIFRKFLHKTALTDADIQGLNDQTLSLYAYGDIVYKDAFGNEWITEFRYCIGGTVGYRPDGVMAHTHDGNNAT